MSNHPAKRAAIVQGLAEWAGKYADAAELLFSSPEEYVERVVDCRSQIHGKYASELDDEDYEELEYWHMADLKRADMVKAIEASFQLKAAE
jgi:hypothetical protein